LHVIRLLNFKEFGQKKSETDFFRAFKWDGKIEENDKDMG